MKIELQIKVGFMPIVREEIDVPDAIIDMIQARKKIKISIEG